jgi:hypothetical protein
MEEVIENQNVENESHSDSESDSRMSPQVSVSTTNRNPLTSVVTPTTTTTTTTTTKLPSKQHKTLAILDWQTPKQNLSERGTYLLETGIWSDCTFVVGLPPNVKVLL